MDALSIDQLYTVFGDLQKAQETQTRTLAQIQRVINEQASGIVEHISTIKDSIGQLAKSIASQKQQRGGATDVSGIVDPIVDAQTQQKRSTEKLNKTIGDSFKTLSSSFLTKDEAQQAAQRQKKEVVKEDPEFKKPTKLEKMAYKEQIATNTKLSALLKEVHDQKEAKQGSGIFKLLSPVLLLLGGFAALSYGAMKFGPVRKFLTEIKTKGIGATLSGLWTKLTDKKVVDWLRGLPLIGRFFDVYDAFKSFIKGDWKQGLKHLAFAIPFGGEIIKLLGGRKFGTKEAFLAPGGATNLMENFSLDNLWQNFKDMVEDMFTPIVDAYKKIVEVFDMFSSGTPDGMKRGWALLADYMPFLKPIASFMLKKQTEAFDWASAAPELKDVKDVNFGDVVKLALGKVYDGIGNFFKKVLNIFMTTGEILGAIGDLFSGDYGKQSAALNRIDEIAPWAGGPLRTAMNILNAFEESGIKDGDGMWEVAAKLIASRGKRSKAYSRTATLAKESEMLTEQSRNLPEGSEERQKVESRAKSVQEQSGIEEEIDRVKSVYEGRINNAQKVIDELSSSSYLWDWTEGARQITAGKIADQQILQDETRKKLNDALSELEKKRKTAIEQQKGETLDIQETAAKASEKTSMQTAEPQADALDQEQQKMYEERYNASRKKLGIMNPWDVNPQEFLMPTATDSTQAPLEQAKEVTQQEKPLAPEDIAAALGASQFFNDFSKRFQQQEKTDKATIDLLKTIAEHTGATAEKPVGGPTVIGGGQPTPTLTSGRTSGVVRGAFPPRG